MVLARDAVGALSRELVTTLGYRTELPHGGWNPECRAVKLPRLNTLTSRVKIVNCKLAGAKRRIVIK